MLWARMVAYVTGTVNQELLLRNEYLGAENRILRGQIKGGLLLSEGEKATLAEIAQRLGRKALEALAAVAKPDTLLARYPKAHRQQIRRIEISPTSRSHRGGLEESRTPVVASDGGQHSPSAWPLSCS
jgi:hypothetical protein